jgi:CubicO group peptidase (beta-lactamase class C family)
MEVSTLCWLASQGKIITSVAAMQVVEKGLIALDDDCGKFVPALSNKDILVGFEGDEASTGMEFDPVTNTFSFKSPREPILKKATKAITLRLLLSHSAGFQYDAMNPMIQEYLAYNGRTAQIPDNVNHYDQPLVFEPGSSWAYGTGIDWAGQVVEAVTKHTLEEYIQENICAKVGMKNTTFHPDKRLDLPPKMEVGFRVPGAPLIAGPAPIPSPAKDALGGVGLYSTAEDYALFLSALLSDDHSLLSKASLEEFFRPQAPNRGDLMGQMQGAFRQYMAGDFLPETEADYSLGGAVNLSAIEGRRSEGSVQWSGMSNPHWVSFNLLARCIPCRLDADNVLVVD